MRLPLLSSRGTTKRTPYLNGLTLFSFYIDRAMIFIRITHNREIHSTYLNQVIENMNTL